MLCGPAASALARYCLFQKSPHIARADRWNDAPISCPTVSSTDSCQFDPDSRLQNSRMSFRSVVLFSTLWAAGCAPGLPDAGHGPGLEGERAFVEDPTPEQIDAGRRIVELQCVSCHAVRSSDVSRSFAAPPLRTLAERYPVAGLPEAFAQGVLVGHPNMPEFRFSATQITEILAYIQSIQTRQGA